MNNVLCVCVCVCVCFFLSFVLYDKVLYYKVSTTRHVIKLHLRKVCVPFPLPIGRKFQLNLHKREQSKGEKKKYQNTNIP